MKWCIGMIIVSAASITFAHQITVFTTHEIGGGPSRVADGNTIKVVYVDNFHRSLAQLNQYVKYQAPSTEKAIAFKSAKTWFQRHQSMLLSAARGVTLAKSEGVKRLPAIVIDHQYQVVGTTNIDLALAALDQYKSHLLQRKGKREDEDV